MTVTPDMEGALQTAIYSRIVADAELNVLLGGTGSFPGGGATVGRCYDFVPERSTPGEDGYPFLVVSDFELNDGGDKDAYGYALACKFHVFSRYKGSAETTQIHACLMRLFHEQAIAPLYQKAYVVRHEHSNNVTERDGRTRHRESRFRFLTQSAD